MAKSSVIQINNFSGGISDDPRKVSASEFQITKHFDIFSQPQKLIPYRSLEADTNDGSTATGMKQYFVRDFLYASASAKLYGLGQTAGGNTKIVFKADATTGNWTLPANSEGNGAVKNGCFVEFKDYLWGFQGTNQLWKWGTLSGTPSITDTAATVGATITSVAQGVVSPEDGYLYMAYNNKIVRIDTSLTITDAVATVGDNYKIVALANYGSNMAIGLAPVASYNGTSKILIWNRASDLFNETIDLGEGDLRVMGVIDGVIVSVTDRYLNNTVGAGIGSMVVQVYAGGTSQVIKEIFTKALTGKTIPLSKAVKNNRLFWSAKIMTNSTGTEYVEGIWSFGRKNAGYNYSLTLDVIDENVDTDGIEAFNIAGNYFFISHSNDGSIDKTNDANTYAFTSVYESQIYSFGDPCLTKQLQQFSVYTAPLPTAGSVTVKYRVDGATAWTTIGSLSTDGALARDFLNIESTGADFASFREVEFRIESTGGAEITGYKIIAMPYIGSEN